MKVLRLRLTAISYLFMQFVSLPAPPLSPFPRDRISPQLTVLPSEPTRYTLGTPAPRTSLAMESDCHDPRSSPSTAGNWRSHIPTSPDVTTPIGTHVPRPIPSFDFSTSDVGERHHHSTTTAHNADHPPLSQPTVTPSVWHQSEDVASSADGDTDDATHLSPRKLQDLRSSCVEYREGMDAQGALDMFANVANRELPFVMKYLGGGTHGTLEGHLFRGLMIRVLIHDLQCVRIMFILVVIGRTHNIYSSRRSHSATQKIVPNTKRMRCVARNTISRPLYGPGVLFAIAGSSLPPDIFTARFIPITS